MGMYSQICQAVGVFSSTVRTLLTERQVSILGLLDQGASTKQVAEHLHLSENTIKTHVRLMYDKLNASNRAECISKAKKLNLL